MGLFRSNRPVFRAIADSIGLLQGDAATSEFENGPVRPRLDVQASIEAACEYRTFVVSQNDAGADTSVLDLDFFDSGDWTEITERNRTFIVSNPIPPLHEGWVIGMGAMSTVTASLTDIIVWREQPTAVSGIGSELLYKGNTAQSGLVISRGSVGASPILIDLPWWIPNLTVTNALMRTQITTSAATVTNLMFRVLSAPIGTFKRLY